MAKSWNDSYKLNISDIDIQHQKLFSIFDSLLEAMSIGKASEKLQAVLNELESYARTHFANEERYMKQFNYSDLQDHVEAHQYFMSKIQSSKESYKAGNLTVAMELVNFLKKWIVKHIQDTDKKYVPTFHSQGIK